MDKKKIHLPFLIWSRLFLSWSCVAFYFG